MTKHYSELDGSDPGERLSVDDAELITEYLLRLSPCQGGARSWIMALAARFDLAAIELDAPPPGGRWPCEITAIVEKGFTLQEQGGILSGLLAGALRDRRITSREADAIEAQGYAEIRLLLRLMRNVRRVADEGSTLGSLDGEE